MVKGFGKPVSNREDNMMRLTTLLISVFCIANSAADNAAEPIGASILIDELEYRLQSGENPLAWSVAVPVGAEKHQLWLISEGDSTRGAVGSNEIRALYSVRMSPDWRLNMGWRGDVKPGPKRNWVLLGLEGEGPFQIEGAVSLIAGKNLGSGLRLELERAFELAPRWSLTPEIKLNLHSRNDPTTGAGSGLSTGEAGLRMAYELSPNFVPYLGIIWERSYGQTAHFARKKGAGGSATHVLAGISLQF